MNGVRVLEETIVREVVNEKAVDNARLLVFLFIACAFVFFANKCIKSCIVSLIVGIAILAVSIHTTKYDEYKQYKVILDDTVTYNNFTRMYEVLEQDGEILTVREKNRSTILLNLTQQQKQNNKGDLL